ncbi:hypothetical protein MNBD_GAMMA08-3174 [hydrothermal vent metagenome]|uniref:Response regulatory domain-containing protein n=1 Tax=hydrothermal vent metagenome TaxID=652676 RepID=A0A3B0Y1H9_9ZZZZ
MNNENKNDIKILIVDDMPDNIYLFRFLLEREGYTILEASNAGDAIQLVKTHSISLILMDIQMPEMDGLEATKIIKKFKPNITIVALTARLMLEDKDEMNIAGCDGIIDKPINPQQFHQQVKSFL